MKRNKFGEIENPHSKVNIVIICIAIIAFMITGIIYAVKLGSINENLETSTGNYYEYCQIENSSIY